MRRMTLLLVCAALAACGNAVPYGKIENGYPAAKTHESYSQSASFASASSSASSYTSGNVQAHPGYPRQESVHFGSQKTAESKQETAPYWWMADNSPFGAHGQQTVEIKGNEQAHVAEQVNQGAVHHQTNPFLGGGAGSSGSYNTASAGQSAHQSGNSGNHVDLTKNPFFNSGAHSAAESHASASAAAADQQTQVCFD